MARFTKFMALAAVAVIGAVPIAAPALAQQSPGRQSNPEYAPTMLVLDASGSMLAADPGGGTKIDAAKNAVRTFIGAAPAASKVGLSVYGTGTGSTDAEKTAGCKDVKVLRNAETIDRPALTSAVDGITPSGYTPIGAALRTAAQALPKDGPRSIVLVSDGLDTCAPPDPCEVARELNKQGNQIVAHAIGFGVDDASRAQLTCIAQTTGGTYTDAADGKTLEQVLPRVTTTALRTYAPAGIRIEGGTDYRSAPVTSPGQYLDTIGHKRQRFYAIDVPAGATAYFSGTAAFPRGDNALFANNRLDLRVYGADGQDCHTSESAMATRSSDGVALTVARVWKGAAQAKTGSPSEDKCRGGGRYYFGLEWAYVADGAPERVPLELIAGIEQSVADPGPAAATAQATFTAPSGPAVPVTGGGSFTVAAELPASGVYADTLRRGEFVFYRVKLDWGRGLAYRVRFRETTGVGSGAVSNINTTLYSPFRSELSSDGTAYTGTHEVLPTNKSALATVPVRYRNRETGDGRAAGQSVDGWYYIAVKLSPAVLTGDPTAAPVPIELELAVTGTAEPGPRYQDGGAGVGIFGEQKPQTGPDVGASTVAVPSDTDDPETGNAVVVAGVAAGVVGAAACVVIVLVRRRLSR
ncbi:VWA domain-containing protein [Nocardia sp. NPDC050710]|uniref:vWA domain-containing protein n=1 Tax=Nocardia sp. NPDC050710 TaxID=3157220 RepID=UPI0033CC7539